MLHTRKIAGAAIALTLTLLSGQDVRAQTFTVSATVLNSCVIVPLPLSFGNFNPSTGLDLDVATSLTALCTVGSTAKIAMNNGLTGTTPELRKMTGAPSGTLEYAIYRDSSRLQVWGSTPDTDTLSYTGTGLVSLAIPVYGRIHGTQSVVPPAGAYTDTVTVSVSF